MKGALSDDELQAAQLLLGVPPDAGDAALRAAYLQKVQQHPPDRDPELFEKIRDAYDHLRDPRAQARRVLIAPTPDTLIKDFLEGDVSWRKYVGPAPWIALLKEKR